MLVFHNRTINRFTRHIKISTMNKQMTKILLISTLSKLALSQMKLRSKILHSYHQMPIIMIILLRTQQSVCHLEKLRRSDKEWLKGPRLHKRVGKWAKIRNLKHNSSQFHLSSEKCHSLPKRLNRLADRLWRKNKSQLDFSRMF